MKEKTPLSHEVVCFLNLKSRYQIRGKLLLSRILMSLQAREPFLRLFYNINSSPLLRPIRVKTPYNHKHVIYLLAAVLLHNVVGTLVIDFIKS